MTTEDKIRHHMAKVVDNHMEFGTVNTTKLAEDAAHALDLDYMLDLELSPIWEIAHEIEMMLENGEFA